MEPAKQRKRWGLKPVTLAILALALIAGLTWQLRSPTPHEFGSLDEFSAVWLSTPEEKRYKLLPWLLGDTPARHTEYDIAKTQLTGLTRSEIHSYLGSEDEEGVIYYRVGTIEDDFFGNLIVPKADALEIQFDDNDVVAGVNTVS